MAAKRFTDTAKWKDEWFKGLTMQAKLVWLFLCDDCDHAGIWITDFEVLSIRTGVRVNEQILEALLGQKVVKIDRKHYFIPSFFKFQYASAKDSFKAKQSALAVLQRLGLADSSGTLKEVSPDTSEQSADCHIIIKGNIKGNTGDARGAEDRPTQEEYETVYRGYPKKVGKSPGLTKLKKQCPTRELLAEFEKAMLAYIAHCKKNEIFYKQFDTFVNSNWRDCLDPDYGDVSAGARADLSEIFEKGAK